MAGTDKYCLVMRAVFLYALELHAHHTIASDAPAATGAANRARKTVSKICLARELNAFNSCVIRPRVLGTSER